MEINVTFVFLVAVGVWAILVGVSHFIVAKETLLTIAAVAAIVTGVFALILAF